MLDKLCNLCCKNPVCLVLEIIGGVILIWALWVHNTWGIVAGIVVALVGLIYASQIDKKKASPPPSSPTPPSESGT